MAEQQHYPSDKPGPTVVLGLAWVDGTAMVRIRQPTKDSHLFQLAGSTLRYQATTVKHCVGFGAHNATSYTDCHTAPQRGERTCVSCSVAEANHASGLHHAHTKDGEQLNPTIASHLKQPNSLYLAMFRDGSMKVGTTTSRRHSTRLLEQGAWMACTVASTADGIEVRKLEDSVTNELGIPQSVSIKRKLAGLATPSDEGALESLLGNKAAEVRQFLSAKSSKPTSDTRVLDASEIWRFTDNVDRAIATKLAGGSHVYSSPVNQGKHHIEIHGACGRIALVTKPDSNDHFLVDLGQLLGFELDIGDHEPAAITVQDALF